MSFDWDVITLLFNCAVSLVCFYAVAKVFWVIVNIITTVFVLPSVTNFKLIMSCKLTSFLYFYEGFFKGKTEKSVFSFCCFISVLNFSIRAPKSICLQASRAQNPQRDLTLYFWSISIPLKCVSFSGAPPWVRVVFRWVCRTWWRWAREHTPLMPSAGIKAAERRSAHQPFRHTPRWNMLKHDARLSVTWDAGFICVLYFLTLLQNRY